MNKFDFDYLLKRSVLINEKADTYWRDNGHPDFQKLYDEIIPIMKTYPQAPTGTTLSNARLNYVVKSLYDFLSKEDLESIGIDKNIGFANSRKDLVIRQLSTDERLENRKMGINKTRDYTPEYAKFAPKDANGMPKNADNSRLHDVFMLRKLVNSFKDEATSPEFAKKLLNKDTIYKFMSIPTSSTSKFASGMKAKKEKMFDMDLGDAYEIQNKANLIIDKLRKNKKLPRGLRKSIYHANSENIGEEGKPLKQDETAPLQAFIDSLEGVLSWKNDVKKIINTITLKMRKKQPITDEEEEAYEKLTPFEKNVLAEYNVNEITKLMQLFAQRLENKQPVKIEKIHSIIDQLGHEKISEFVKTEFDELLSDYGNIVFSADEDRYATIYDTLDDNLLKGLVDEGIITDEESQVLAKWRKIASSGQQSIVRKSSKDEEKASRAQSREDVKNIRQGEYEKRAKKWEADKKSKELGVKKSKIDIGDEIAGLSASEIEEKLGEMMDVDDPDYAKIDAISKYITKLKNDNPEDEEGVMGYMTEQVYRDRFSDNRGKFVDRGFKKPKNYAHWLWLNEQ
jgi:hypothetical protein